MKSCINYFISISLFFSCSGTKESSDKTLAERNGKNDDLINLLRSIPVVNEPFYFNASNEDQNLDFKKLPDSLIDKMGQDSVLNYWMGKSYSPNINLERKNHYKYSNEKIEFLFYRRLPFDSTHYDILAAIENPPSTKSWQIMSFDLKGKEVSLVDGIHGVYLQKNKLFTWWWYASNERPDFATWIRNSDGGFEKTSEKQEVPIPLSEIIDVHGELKKH